jgi:hypothetical protein
VRFVFLPHGTSPQHRSLHMLPFGLMTLPLPLSRQEFLAYLENHSLCKNQSRHCTYAFASFYAPG